MKKSLSQDLSKELAAQQQQLLHLQTQTKAANDQWLQQKSRIAEDTKVTIAASKAAIETATKDGKKKLAKLETSIQATRAGHETELADLTGRESELQASIRLLEHDQKVLVQTNSTLNTDSRNLNSELTIHREELAALKDEETAVAQHISALREEEDTLSISNIALTSDKQLLEDDIAALVTDFETKKTESERELTILSKKRDTVMQEIIENRATDDKTRENLANWQRDLAEQEKSIRIREMQLDEQSKAIARNYNLLSI